MWEVGVNTEGEMTGLDKILGYRPVNMYLKNHGIEIPPGIEIPA